jgi:hypothetical protein
LPSVSNRNVTHVCDACQQGKSHQLPFPKSVSVSKTPLELVFSDVWGPAPTSAGKHNYYVSFIDDFSKFIWIYLLQHKSEVFQKFYDFEAHVERLFDRKVLAMQTDWGGEYHKLRNFFERIGISHHVSCPHTHQQNGSAERKHRHIVETGLALFAHASMPLKFWDEPFLIATFLINRLPTPVLHHISPIEKLFATKPDYSFLCTFDCACWLNLRPYNTQSLPFDQNSVLFLAIAHIIRGTNVSIYPLVVFIFLVMLFLTRLFSLFLRFIPMSTPVFAQKSCSFLHPWLILR